MYWNFLLGIWKYFFDFNFRVDFIDFIRKFFVNMKIKKEISLLIFFIY